MTQVNRRSFLKLAGAALPAILLPRASSWLDENFRQRDVSLPNIVILLFDAMSARNLSVYGYPRPTSPNLERFAERAVVFHSHYAGGNFTTPGVASLLTGTYPWKHRAINQRGILKDSMIGNNIFRVLGSDYYRLAFPQNFWAYFILTQFQDDIEVLLPSGSFSELDFLLSDYLPQDKNMAARALDDFVFNLGDVPPALVLGSLQRTLYTLKSTRLPTNGYPTDIPHDINFPLNFRLEKVVDGLISLFSSLPPPFFTYLHLLPPHSPYRPKDQYFTLFRDGLKPIRKPIHRFSEGLPNSELNLERRLYDEYVASLDSEFGRLLDYLENEGILETSYVIITSDHGEMFERGEKAHSTPLLYDPVVHIPLLISLPGKKDHRDIYTPTSAVDLLPTLAQLAGKSIPAWGDGKVLPGFGGTEEPERSIYVIEAKRSSAYGPLTKATVMLQKGSQKLIYYTGYEQEDTFELYDLSEDLEELNDLYPDQPAIVKQMREELLEAFFTASKPYMK